MDLPASLTIKASLVLAIALVAMRPLRGRSAALRHWVLSTAVLCAFVLPLLEMVAPSWSVSFGRQETTEPQMALASAPVQTPPGTDVVVEPAAAMTTGSTVFGVTASPRTAARWLYTTWLAGAAASVGVLLIGLGRLSWLARRATPVTDTRWHEPASDLSGSYGLRRRVRLLQSDHPAILAAWGWRTPTVIVPASASGWSVERIRVVLGHEFAHVRRQDWSIQMTAEVLRSFLWFNPLAWTLCRRLRLESERACDDEVIGRGWKGPSYAAHVMELARTLAVARSWMPVLPAPSMARASDLERRVAAMLNARIDRRPPTRTSRLAIAAPLAATTVLIAGFAISAQTLSTLAGTVVDQTGRHVPGARLVLENPANQSKYEVRSDRTGRYVFVGLPAGEYTLESVLPGFAHARAQVTIAGADTSERRIELQVGSLEETITVVSTGTPEAPRMPTPEEAQAAADRLRSRRGVEGCPATTDVGGNIRAPRRLNDVRPVYPDHLSAAKIGGAVRMEGVIGIDGAVRDVRVVSSAHPDLDQAAVEAVRQWVFDTTLLNCQPVDVTIIVRMNFEIRPPA